MSNFIVSCLRVSFIPLIHLLNCSYLSSIVARSIDILIPSCWLFSIRFTVSSLLLTHKRVSPLFLRRPQPHSHIAMIIVKNVVHIQRLSLLFNQIEGDFVDLCVR